LFCCGFADVAAEMRFVPEQVEAENAAYVGVVSLVVIAITICLIVVADVVTLVNKKSRIGRRQSRRKRVKRKK